VIPPIRLRSSIEIPGGWRSHPLEFKLQLVGGKLKLELQQSVRPWM